MKNFKTKLLNRSTDLWVTIAKIFARYVCFFISMYVYFTAQQFHVFPASLKHTTRIENQNNPSEISWSNKNKHKWRQFWDIWQLCVCAVLLQKGKGKTKYMPKRKQKMPTNCANWCFCVAPLRMAFQFIYFCSSFVVSRCCSCCWRDAQLQQRRRIVITKTSNCNGTTNGSDAQHLATLLNQQTWHHFFLRTHENAKKRAKWTGSADGVWGTQREREQARAKRRREREWESAQTRALWLALCLLCITWAAAALTAAAAAAWTARTKIKIITSET